MLTILLHSSKTMRQPSRDSLPYQAPQLLDEATELALYLRSLSAEQIGASMTLSSTMAQKTHALLANWDAVSDHQLPAIDIFLGDIYSGFQAQTLTAKDRAFANAHLIILSGLYGGLRALDSIHPYRLEMGYRFPADAYKSLYRYWGSKIAHILPPSDAILNLSAVEYTKAVLPYITDRPVITPKFMTISQKTGQPQFVTVHAKIARGAFARWVIRRRLSDPNDLTGFNELGYHFAPELSTPDVPVFVCDTFEGIGLSVRLS